MVFRPRTYWRVWQPANSAIKRLFQSLRTFNGMYSRKRTRASGPSTLGLCCTHWWRTKAFHAVFQKQQEPETALRTELGPH